MESDKLEHDLNILKSLDGIDPKLITILDDMHKFLLDYEKDANKPLIEITEANMGIWSYMGNLKRTGNHDELLTTLSEKGLTTVFDLCKWSLKIIEQTVSEHYGVAVAVDEDASGAGAGVGLSEEVQTDHVDSLGRTDDSDQI